MPHHNKHFRVDQWIIMAVWKLGNNVTMMGHGRERSMECTTVLDGVIRCLLQMIVVEK